MATIGLADGGTSLSKPRPVKQISKSETICLEMVGGHRDQAC